MKSRSVSPPDRLPPHSDEAEVGVLGSMLLDNRVIADVANILKREDFYSGDHQVIYEAIVELFGQGKPADLVTLTEALKAKGHLERIGGSDYLVGLVEKVPSTAQAQHYGRIVAGHARRRRLAQAAERLRETALDPTATEEELGEAVERIAVAGNGHLGGGRLDIIWLADVESQPIRWLWPNWLARGKLALLCGHAGLGKSLLVCDLAARISQGRPWPDGAEGGDPGRVLLVAGEDDPGDMLKPRLEVAGGDPARVGIVQTARAVHNGQKRLPDLTQDLPEIEKEIERLGGVDLLAVDPLTCFVPGVNTDRDAEIRSLVLGPLGNLAQRHDCAILVVLHLRKAAADVPLHRIGGSVALGAAARLVWLLHRHPDAPGELCLALLKSNIGPLELPVLGCRIEDRDGVPLLAWDVNPIGGLTPEDLLAAERRERDSELEEAKGWLREVLADGPMPVRELRGEAKAAGFSWATIRRAKDALGIKPRREGFGEFGQWTWGLSND